MGALGLTGSQEKAGSCPNKMLDLYIVTRSTQNALQTVIQVIIKKIMYQNCNSGKEDGCNVAESAATLYRKAKTVPLHATKTRRWR
jgi:hypothetical protein